MKNKTQEEVETWPIWLESKEKYKSPEINSKEMEIYKLPDKEFKIIILSSTCYKRTQRSKWNLENNA